MKTFWGSVPAAVIALLVIVILSFHRPHVESRPWLVESLFRPKYAGSPSGVDLFQQYLDYDIDSPTVIQGPRGRRWAFPLDVQEIRCPQGQKLHSSGYRCVPNAEGNDDY